MSCRRDVRPDGRPALDEHGDCYVCGAVGGDPCPDCGGERYHEPGCATLEQWERADELAARARVTAEMRWNPDPWMELGDELARPLVAAREQAIDAQARRLACVAAGWSVTDDVEPGRWAPWFDASPARPEVAR